MVQLRDVRIRDLEGQISRRMSEIVELTKKLE
jgi:hypothetical protein